MERSLDNPEKAKYIFPGEPYDDAPNSVLLMELFPYGRGSRFPKPDDWETPERPVPILDSNPPAPAVPVESPDSPDSLGLPDSPAVPAPVAEPAAPPQSGWWDQFQRGERIAKEKAEENAKKAAELQDIWENARKAAEARRPKFYSPETIQKFRDLQNLPAAAPNPPVAKRPQTQNERPQTQNEALEEFALENDEYKDELFGIEPVFVIERERKKREREREREIEMERERRQRVERERKEREERERRGPLGTARAVNSHMIGLHNKDTAAKAAAEKGYHFLDPEDPDAEREFFGSSF